MKACALAAVAALALATEGASAGLVRLVRAQPRMVRTACRAAQAHVRLHVVCPTLIPATRYVSIEGLHGEMDFSRSLWGITFNNGDNGPGYVHWMAGGGSLQAVRYYLLGDAVNEVKGLPRLIRRTHVHGHPLALYEYPQYPAGGPNGGHTAAFVTCGGTVLYASIHGHGREAAVAAMALDLARRAHCRRAASRPAP